MILTTFRRGAVLAALATVAGLLTMPALQAQAATKAATSLSIRVARPAIAPGGSDRVAGHLAIRGDLSPAGRTVTLEARPLGTDEFVPVAETTTGDRGGVRLTVTPDVSTRYRWRYAGDDDARPSVSGVASIRVRTGTDTTRRLPTALSIRALQRVGKTGTVDLVRGVLRARRGAVRHRPVLLLSKTADDSAWALEGIHRTQRRGVVRFRVDPEQATGYRLVFLGTARLRPARSAIVRVPVRPDVAISADPQSIEQGASTTVSGLVTYQGAPLAGATVKLWAVKVGRPHSGRVLDTGTTADDGSVSFTGTPRVSLRYRLRVVPSDAAAGVVSAAVTVRVVPVPAPTS